MLVFVVFNLLSAVVERADFTLMGAVLFFVNSVGAWVGVSNAYFYCFKVCSIEFEFKLRFFVNI